jgi:hypothetical protein
VENEEIDPDFSNPDAYIPPAENGQDSLVDSEDDER